jgi:hypothetical protein
MGSPVAIDPSEKGLPSRIETLKPFWAGPSYRASVSGAQASSLPEVSPCPDLAEIITSSSK